MIPGMNETPPTIDDRPAGPGSVGLMWLVILLAGALLLMVTQYLLFPLSNMPGRGLRYLLFPPLILALFVMAGARYVQHIYGLTNMASGFRYLMARLFGQSLPSLIVSDGKIVVNVMGQENLVSSVGGPGYLMVMPGNVALLEGLDGRLRVVGAGRHFLTAQDSVKEALSLEERYDQIEKTSATTRDGIELTANDIRFRYRVYTGPRAAGFGRTPENPYPYSNEGVINLVYNAAMGANGISDWHSGVKGLVEGVMQDFIRTNLFDHMTAPDPDSEDPRSEVYRLYESEGVKKRFNEKGVELLWIDIGHLELPEKVAGQRVDLWQVRWSGNARIMRAHGEAERSKYRLLGRAQAQVDILTNILRTLESSGAQGDAQQSRRTLLMTQLLESMNRTALNPPAEPKKKK